MISPVEISSEPTTSQTKNEWVVNLVENRTTTVETPEAVSDVNMGALRSLLKTAGSGGLFDFRFELNSDGRRELILETDSTVGLSVASTTSGRQLVVRVAPKIEATRTLELMAFAGLSPQIGQKGVGLAAENGEDLFETIAIAFADTVHALVTRGGLRSTHQRRSEQLNARLKGKLLIRPMMSNIAKGHPERIPCEFPSLEKNNRFNRVLRWAIQIALRRIQEKPGTVHSIRQLKAAAGWLSGVDIARPTSTDLGSTQHLPPNMRHYARPIGLARHLIEAAGLDFNVGGFPVRSFALRMEDVFEKALRRVVESAFPRSQFKPTWFLDLESHSDLDQSIGLHQIRLEPDLFVPEDSSALPMVVDAKWKDVTIVGGGSSTKISVSNSDLFQLHTYAIQAMKRSSVQGCIGSLVFPSDKTGVFGGYDLKLGSLGTIFVRYVGWDVTGPIISSATDLQINLGKLRSPES